MNQKILVSAVAFGACALSQIACQPVGGAGGGMKTGAQATARCGQEAIIDDGEDQNNQVLVQDGRSGYWYTFVDDTGSTVPPTAGSQGGTFAMTAGGANGSQYAARMSGTVGAGGIVYAGMGFNFVDPKDAYDASKYGGIAFYAKKAGAASSVRLKLPDVSTDPQGSICKQCFNDFGANMNLTDAWTQYVLPFEASKQEEGWGAPRVPSITPSKMFGVQWQVNTPGAAYDVWVDDVSFVGCDSANAAPPAPAAPAPQAPAAAPTPEAAPVPEAAPAP
jgi:endoglucanase